MILTHYYLKCYLSDSRAGTESKTFKLEETEQVAGTVELKLHVKYACDTQFYETFRLVCML